MKSSALTRKWTALLISLVLLLNVGFAAAEAQPKEELFGSPWINSAVIGNVLPEKPDVKDDLYQSVNYETILEHQELYIPMLTAGTAIQTTVLGMIAETDVSDPEMKAL